MAGKGLNQEIHLGDISKLFTKKNKKAPKEKAFKPRDVVAFDIGTKTTKVVEGKYTSGKILVYNMFEFHTPEGAIEDGKITNEKDLVEAIKINLKKNMVKSKEAIITTSSSTIISRDIIIPVVADDEMETVIRYEIEQYLPIKLDDYIIQFTVLDKLVEADGEKYKVNVVSYPKITASGYYDLLTELDLTPLILDVNFNSLRKLIQHCGINNNGGTVAFVDMGATSINVTIFNQGKLDFTRIIKYGGDSIDYALSTKLDMSIKSTESEKIEKADLKDIGEYDVLNNALKETMDEILGELERILQFYNNQSISNKIDKVIIYGGTSNIGGLESYMEEKSGIKTEKITTLNNVEFEARKKVGVNTLGDYANVIGSFIRL